MRKNATQTEYNCRVLAKQVNYNSFSKILTTKK